MGYKMNRNTESPFDFGEGTGSSPLKMEYNEDVARAGTNVQQMIQGTPNRSAGPEPTASAGGGWNTFHSATASRVQNRQNKRAERRARRAETRAQNIEETGHSGLGGRINLKGFQRS